MAETNNAVVDNLEAAHSLVAVGEVRELDRLTQQHFFAVRTFATTMGRDFVLVECRRKESRDPAPAGTRHMASVTSSLVGTQVVAITRSRILRMRRHMSDEDLDRVLREVLRFTFLESDVASTEMQGEESRRSIVPPFPATVIENIFA